MLIPLEIPLEAVEEGPVKDCLEIVRRWAEGVYDAQEGTLAGFGLKVDHVEGTLQPSTDRYLSPPDGKPLIAAYGLTQGFPGWKPMSTTATTASAWLSTGTNLQKNDVAVRNTNVGVTFQYKVLLIYKDN